MQEGFKQEHGLQCGFCTPGMLMSSYALLQNNPTPSEEEIRWAISGNLCRCTGYQNIVKAIQYAANKMAKGAKHELRDTSPEIGGMGHSIKRKEDLRFIQGQGNYVEDVNCPTWSTAKWCAVPTRTRGSKASTPKRPRKLPGVLAVITGEDLAKAGLAVDAHALLRQADGACHRQGSVPGTGSRICGGRRPLRRCRCGRAGGSGL